MLTCTKCKESKPESGFHQDKRNTKRTHQCQCKHCRSIVAAASWERRKHIWVEQGLCSTCGGKLDDSKHKTCFRCREYSRDRNKKWREEALAIYGKSKCACCGESRFEFLAIDHIAGGGAEHRRSIGSKGGNKFYYWLKQNNYPGGFQVLCHNCNQAKGLYGCCPHEHERKIDWDVPLCGIDLTQWKEAAGL